MLLTDSRRIWIGGAAVCITVALPLVLQAQEFLPPVIDRSTTSGTVQQTRPAQQSNLPTQKQVLSLEDRVKRLERLLDNEALVDMLMRIDSMQAESEELRGEVETLNHSIEAINQRQRDLYLDMDRRLRQVELNANASTSAVGAGSSAGASVPVPATSGGAVVNGVIAGADGIAAVMPMPATTISVDPEVERSAYQTAFDSLKNGEYDKAISQFQTFLASYPSGDYTDNAQYWLGEANYVTRHFKIAEQEFLKVLELHPDSSKVGDAMLKLGYTYYELSNWDAARKTLENAVSRFPNTTVGRLAENRLQKMRLEGR